MFASVAMSHDITGKYSFTGNREQGLIKQRRSAFRPCVSCKIFRKGKKLSSQTFHCKLWSLHAYQAPFHEYAGNDFGKCRLLFRRPLEVSRGGRKRRKQSGKKIFFLCLLLFSVPILAITSFRMKFSHNYKKRLYFYINIGIYF